MRLWRLNVARLSLETPAARLGARRRLHLHPLSTSLCSVCYLEVICYLALFILFYSLLFLFFIVQRRRAASSNAPCPSSKEAFGKSSHYLPTRNELATNSRWVNRTNIEDEVLRAAVGLYSILVFEAYAGVADANNMA